MFEAQQTTWHQVDMTPLPKHLEHLYSDAMWIIIDPWQEQFCHYEYDKKTINAINNYYAHMIHQYIQHHDIQNTMVLNIDHNKYPTHKLFAEYKHIQNPYYHKVLKNMNVVFCGFHSGICINEKGVAPYTPSQQRKRNIKVYVKTDLCCALPSNWLDTKDYKKYEYTFYDQLDAYNGQAILI